MKNSNLKNILISAGIAVFAGVLLMGVNSAFGIVVPTQTPTLADNISPTFTGLNLVGDMDVRGSISNSVGVVDISDEADIDVVRTGSILSQSNGDVEITADGVIRLTADQLSIGIQSVPSFTTLWGGTTVEALNVNGVASFYQRLLAVNDIIARGTIYNSEGSVVINDDVTVSGGVVVGDSLSPRDLTVWGNSDVKGTIKTKKIDSGPNPLIINADTIQPVSIGTATFPTTGLAVYGSVDVTGTLKANRFGTYYQVDGTYYPSVAAGTTLDRTVSCNAGDYLVSCDYAVYSDYSDVYISKNLANLSTNTCTTRAKNTSTATRYIIPYATCLNPDL